MVIITIRKTKMVRNDLYQCLLSDNVPKFKPHSLAAIARSLVHLTLLLSFTHRSLKEAKSDCTNQTDPLPEFRASLPRLGDCRVKISVLCNMALKFGLEKFNLYKL